LFIFEKVNNPTEMTSIMATSCYQDIIEIDSLSIYNHTIEEEPLDIILELALGMEKNAIWERGYKAT
jgi:hypothetical protein